MIATARSGAMIGETPIRTGGIMPNEEACRRLAAQLAAQLPEDRESAMKTIEYLRQFAEVFIYPVAASGGEVVNLATRSLGGL